MGGGAGSGGDECVHCADGHLQIPDLAIFGECVGSVAWLPSAVSVLVVFLRYGMRPLWRQRPIWLRDFAAEEPGETDEAPTGVSAPLGRTRFLLPVAALLVNSAIGLVISMLAGLNVSMGPLFLTPLIPCVSTACPLSCNPKARSLG